MHFTVVTNSHTDYQLNVDNYLSTLVCLSKQKDRHGDILLTFQLPYNARAAEAIHYAAYTKFSARCELSTIVAAILVQ
jgi:hypothetical protein